MVMTLNLEQSPGAHPLEAWLALDEGSVISELKSVGPWSPHHIELKSIIVSILQQAKSDRVRNAAAIAIVDLKATDAAHDIIDVLRRPEVAKVSGTLIYAVDELGASIPFLVLARLLELGSYEARAQALLFFEENRIALGSEDDQQEGWQVLTSLAVGDDIEGAEAGRLALDLLHAAETPSRT